jgi:hypothetical protein
MALPSDWATFLAAIRAQESGGNYTQDSAGCLGGYCWNAQSNWDAMAAAAGEKQYIGVNPSQVPATIQDRVASFNLYRAYQQGGNSLAAAARWWNGGSTSSEANPGLPAQPWAPHCGGGSSAAYACQVLARMGLGGHYLAGAGSGAGGVVTTAAKGQADCLVGFGGIPGTSWFNDIFGSGGNIGGFCLLTKSQGRAVLAIAVIASGGVILGFGLGLTLAFTRTGRQVMAVVSAVPGAGGLSRAAGAGDEAA